jgi:DNA mismatch endonuclease, patch repair protein
MASIDRAENMRRIRSKDSKPELAVRRLLFSLGYRYRLHARKLPGNPDIVFPSRRKVIFVHGCFWHGHLDCARSHVPQTNQAYWGEKIGRNMERDENSQRKLAEAGWQSLIVWECSTRDMDRLKESLIKFLGD